MGRCRDLQVCIVFREVRHAIINQQCMVVPLAHIRHCRNPLVSFVYERGWRQGFAWAGFPGAYSSSGILLHRC